jgi:hypothetical protein
VSVAADERSRLSAATRTTVASGVSPRLAGSRSDADSDAGKEKGAGFAAPKWF